MLKLVVAVLSLALLSEAVDEQSSKPKEVPKLISLNLKNYEDRFFYTNIHIGSPPTKLSVAITTSMSCLWFPVDPCNKSDPACGNHTSYNVAPDIIGGNSFREDTVTIEGLAIRERLFVGGYKYDSEKWKNYPFDGFMRLAVDRSNNGIVPKLYNQELIDNNLFSLYLIRNGTSEQSGLLVLGGVDPNHITGEFTYRYCQPDFYNTKWEFTLDNVHFGNSSLCEGTKYCGAVINIAYRYIGVPFKQYKTIVATIGVLRDYNRYIVDCSKIARLPPLTITIGNMNFTFTPNEYVVREKGGKCSLAFYHTIHSFWTLGIPFLAKCYTGFELNENVLGFALAK